MDVQSVLPIWNRNVADTILKGLLTAPSGAFLTTPSVHLFGSDPGTITPDSLLADFTAMEIAYTGYAAALVGTLVGPVRLTTAAEGMIKGVAFVAPNPLTVQGVAWGFWIDGAPGPDWCVAERFANQVPFAVPGDFLALEIAFAFGLYTPAGQ